MKKIGNCLISRNEDVDQLRFDWGTLHFLSAENVTGAKSFSFGHVELAAGKGHVRHNHPDADEIIYVMSGTGEQMLDDEPPTTIRQGDCIWIPKGIYHSTINQGHEAMKLLVVYSPAGAEQVLWQDPGVRVYKAGEH